MKLQVQAWGAVGGGVLLTRWPMNRTIKQGSRGPLVETWQAIVGVEADGIFGALTYSKTCMWQHDHGLTMDGVVGPATWAAAGLGLPQLDYSANVVADISHYQRVDDLAQVAHAVALCALKATQGLSYADPTFADRVAGLRLAGCPRIAAYHYLTGVSGIEQAAHFIDTLAGVGAAGIIPVLDFESAPDGEAHADSCKRALEFVTHVENALGRPCVVYTYTSFLRTFKDNAAGLALATRALWIARYCSAADPGSVDPWAQWAAWQYTPRGRLAGIANHVDLSRIVDLAVFDAATAPHA